MRKRADAISAELQIHSTPGHGTAVQAIAPIPAKLMPRLWPTSVCHFFGERRFHGKTINEITDSAAYRR
jgi:hypothetical protein